MQKLKITYNHNQIQKTCELSGIIKCEQLSEKPALTEYHLTGKEKKELLKTYTNLLRITKNEEKKQKLQEKIDNIDLPRMVEGIHLKYGDNPNQYFEIECLNGKIKNLAVDGTVKLIEIPVQETEIEILEKS